MLIVPTHYSTKAFFYQQRVCSIIKCIIYTRNTKTYITSARSHFLITFHHLFHFHFITPFFSSICLSSATRIIKTFQLKLAHTHARTLLLHKGPPHLRVGVVRGGLQHPNISNTSGAEVRVSRRRHRPLVAHARVSRVVAVVQEWLLRLGSLGDRALRLRRVLGLQVCRRGLGGSGGLGLIAVEEGLRLAEGFLP